MSNLRANALVQQFEAVNNDVIALVEQSSDADWKKTCADEQWSVGVTARHLASGYRQIAGLVAAVATGQTLPPITRAMIDQGNAQHAQAHANCTKPEVLDLLRNESAAANQIISGLSDEQLDNTVTGEVFGGTVSAQRIAEYILIAHTGQHLASLKATVGA
ncbi:MAG: DinB family protein [Caldilineaceae bacterium]